MGGRGDLVFRGNINFQTKSRESVHFHIFLSDKIIKLRFSTGKKSQTVECHLGGNIMIFPQLVRIQSEENRAGKQLDVMLS